MKIITAFFRLVRWPNLVFIAFAQFLFFYCIILPCLPDAYFQLHDKLTAPVLYLLVLASVLIAAGGYIINDYFDINIDQVNKPGKMVVEKIIYRRHAILLHIIITSIGVAVSLYVSLKTNAFIIIGNVICTLLLWFYSTTFKRKLLVGNIIISALTAWVIVVLYLATNTTYWVTINQNADIFSAMQRIYKFAAMYASFAFVVSLVREVVKDMEDIKGDRRYNCKTMPIVWGIPASKVFVAVWIVVLLGSLTILLFYVMHIGWWLLSLYFLLFLLVPLVWILKLFYNSTTSLQYHQISNLLKLVMLFGILSMLFFKFYP